jgi:hypothetical protein
MAHVKVSGLFYPEALPKVRNGKKKRDGYCKNCGKKLTDKESLARGFGHDCFSKIPVLVVLAIPAGGTTLLAPDRLRRRSAAVIPPAKVTVCR